jgi:ribosomal protein S18 acetylase RimI-like enzyme
MIAIRKATLKDSEAIAACLLLSMEDIVYRFIGEKDQKKAKEFMFYFTERENNQYSYQNCWVAEENKEVVAAVNVYDGAQLSALREPVIDYLQNRFNTNLIPEDETGAEEYYIDSLGVKPNQQGKGTGTKVLQFVIDEYVTKLDQILGLLVDEENPNARRLYLKLGFKTVGKKSFLGKNMEHLQMKKGNGIMQNRVNNKR